MQKPPSTPAIIEKTEGDAPATAVTHLTRAEVCRYLRRSHSMVRNYERAGRLHALGSGTDTRYFELEEVKALARELSEGEDEREAPKSEALARANAIGDIVQTSSDHANNLSKANLELHDLLLKDGRERMQDSKMLFDVLLKDRDRLIAELGMYQNERKDLWDSIDEVRKHLYDRELARVEVEKKIGENKLLHEGAALLLPALIAAFVGGEHAVESATTKLLQSLTPEQQARIFPELTAKQITALMLLIDRKNGKAPESEETENPAPAQQPAAKSNDNEGPGIAKAQVWFGGGASFAELGDEETD